MSAPVPENILNGTDTHTVGEQMGMLGPVAGQPSAQALQNFANSKVGPDVAALLAAIKAPKADLATFHTAPDAVAKGNSGGDFWSAAKNVIDFISTPFYMVTNAANNIVKDHAGGNPDADSLGTVLADIGKGIGQGWDAGVNHNPDNAKDFIDVINNDPKSPVQNSNWGKSAGFAMDLLGDPLNFIPGTGIGKGVIKGAIEGAGAAREAGRAAGVALDKGAEAAGALKGAEQGGKGAETASDAVELSGTGQGAPVAQKAAQALDPAARVKEFESIPGIANALQNQSLGKLGAFGKAFGNTFKDSVQSSDIGKFLDNVRQNFKKAPIPVTPENVALSQVKGVENATRLAEEPVTSMAPVGEIANPEKTIAEKHLGEGGHDLYKGIQDAISSTNWVRPPTEFRKAQTDYKAYIDAAKNNAQDMSQALSFEQFVDKVHPGAKADLTIADPFGKGNIQVSQKYLREMAPEGERQAVARAIGLPENTPPAELTNKFFALKNKYLEAKKEIDGLYKKEPETSTAEATKQAVKQQDIRNSAAANTLADSAWNNMTPEQRQATRAANAKAYMDNLNQPAKLSVYGDAGPGLKAVSPATQQKIAASSVDEVMKLQQAQLGKRTKQGYQITPERAAGKDSTSGIVHPLLYNTQSNQRMLQAIVRKTKTEINGILKNSGARLSKFPKGEGMDIAGFAVREMRAAESAIQALGMIPHLAMGRLKGESGAIHLFLGDIFEAMLAHNDIRGKGLVSANLLRKHFFGAGASKSVNSQAFLTAVEGLLRERKLIHDEMAKAGGALSPERMKELTDKAKERVKGALLNQDKYYNEARTSAERKNIEASIDQYSSRTDYAHDMKLMADAMVDDPHFGAMLEQRHLYNEALHKADLEKYAQNNWADLEKTLNNYGKMNWTPQTMIEWVNQHIKGAKDVLPYTDKATYVDDINKLKEQFISPAEEKAANASFGDNTVSKDTTETVTKEIVNDRLKANTPDFPVSLSDIRLGEIATDTLRAIHPVRSFFDAKYPFAASGFYGEVVMGSHSRARIQNLYHQTIQSHIMKYNKADTLLDDFRAVQKASVEGTELEAGTSAYELSQITNVLFSEDNPWVKGLKDGSLSKRYFGDVLEAKMALKHIDVDWWDEATGPELADLWKHVNLEKSSDAADFFSTFHSTLAQIYNDRAIAHSFEKTFGSTVPKEGYVKLTWTNKGKDTKIIKNRGYYQSRFTAERQPGLWEILNKDLYYEKNAAMEIPALHRLMNESRKVTNDTAIGKFTNHILDPVTQVMKVFQTTLRPGHWVSNFMGDSIRLHMAGVHDPKAYAFNLAILKELGKDEGLYTTPIAKFERITRIAQKDYSFKLPKDMQPGDIPLKFSDGSKGSISKVELGRMMEDIGVYMAPHGFGQHEDFINELERGPAGHIVNTVNNTMDKVINVGGRFSLNKMGALRDNINRGPLALNILFNGSYKDISDLRAQMSAVVRKWAPTSQDFTREESMYARRAVFYYTWLRGMLPNIVETLVEKPGIYNLPNKALYAWAKANNVDPMSIGNPFPANKMFPSYYYENVIGPQIQAQGGALWGFSPMAPSIDVLDTMFNGVNSESVKQGNMLQAVGNNFASMLSPFAKIPFEAISGQSGNVPIKDTGQYLQDQLLPPQLDLISKLSGKELYDPNLNRTDKGNKEPIQGMPLDLWNFLSGTHTTDYTSPAATRAAIGELRTDRSTIKSDNKRAAR